MFEFGHSNTQAEVIAAMGSHASKPDASKLAGLGSEAKAATPTTKHSCDTPSTSSPPISLPFHTKTMLPDLVASSTSRPDTQETAAYAASQPLFDVLRGAISRIDEQKAHLIGAKDTVQHIHVKVPQEHIENNGTLPNDYRDSLVTAWKVTTESYVRIFEQLCELTGPDPASGRQAEDSYAGFQKLLFTAEAARTVAFEQDAENLRAKGTAESSSDSESSASSKVTTPTKTKQKPAEVASGKRVAPSESSPSQTAQRPTKKQRITENQTSSTPADKATNQSTSQSSVNTVQRLKPKQIRKERKKRIHQQQQQQQQASMLPPTTTPTPAEPTPTTTAPQVEYADVTAEVDARLRAKEEAKKAKKAAKKRKRESHGSHILEAEPGAEVEAVQKRAVLLAQKPAKKRSKGDNGEGVRVDDEKVPARGKRGVQEESGQAQGADEGARRSKRKKT
jgi:hypothetical protein